MFVTHAVNWWKQIKAGKVNLDDAAMTLALVITVLDHSATSRGGRRL
ncbi:MAG: hypothetical protein ACJ71U_20995 [Terriglobales bacterium]